MLRHFITLSVIVHNSKFNDNYDRVIAHYETLNCQVC